mgnify:CR=1 FL=1
MTSYIYGQVKSTDPTNPIATQTQEEGLKDYRAYVNLGFKSMLGREAGEVGYDYWTKDLKSGQHHYAQQGMSQKDAFQKSLSDFYANLARHAPGTTQAHDVNTLGYSSMTDAEKTFGGEFVPEDDVTDVTGSSSPYAKIINTAFSRVHGRTAGAIGMNYWGDEMKKKVEKGMSVDEATAQLYQNLLLNPEAASNIIHGEGPNLQPLQNTYTTNTYYGGGGGGKTMINLANNNDSPTAADQMRIGPTDPLIGQASTRNDYGRALRQNRQGVKAGGVGGLNIGGLG